MSDNQVAILVLAAALVVFRGYFAYLDVSAGVRPGPSVIIEIGLSILAIVTLAAVFWIERALAIAIGSTVLALCGHSYRLYTSRKAGPKWDNAGLESIAGDALAVVGCLGILVVSVAVGQAWSTLLTVFVALYLVGVGYGYIQRRRFDSGRAGVESR